MTTKAERLRQDQQWLKSQHAAAVKVAESIRKRRRKYPAVAKAAESVHQLLMVEMAKTVSELSGAGNATKTRER